MTLVLSVVALILGPIIYAWGQHRPTGKQILDGFILIVVAGIVCVHIIPESIGKGGTIALAFLLAGLAFPVVVERVFHRSLREAHLSILLLAACGLAAHAIVDGVALMPEFADSLGSSHRTNPGLAGSMFDNPLALGVILHRLPVGMAIWWTVRPALGTPAALATFALVVGATAFAYFEGGTVVALAEIEGLAWFQAFVAGSLVHIVAFGVDHHHTHGDHTGRAEQSAEPGSSWGFRVGVLIGMFTVFTVPYIH